MKTKSKQLNKNLGKEQNCEVDENPIEVLRRTSGTKPFQLSKIRSQKRSSLETVNPASRLDFPRNKSQSQQYVLSEQSKDIFLDLMINKKTLFNTHHNKILQSQRKNIIYVAEIQNAEKLQTHTKTINHIIQTEENNKVEDTNLTNHHETKHEINQTCHEKKKSKCQCCLHLNHYLTQAVIQRSESQFFNTNKEQYTQKSNSELKEDEINALLQLKYVKEKAEKSPFSFTSLKWRTKSQHFQVDKWKEKYGKHDLDQYGQKAESLSKVLKGSKTQRINRSQEPLKLRQKVKKPTILTSRQRLPSLTKLLTNKGINLQSDNLLQIITEEQSRQPTPLFTTKYQDLDLMLDSYRNSGFRQENKVDLMFKKREQFENSRQTIGIEQAQVNCDISCRNIAQNKEDNLLNRQNSNEEKQINVINDAKSNLIAKEKTLTTKTKSEKITKKKVDKIRFPSIQGAAVRSLKPIEEKKPLRNLHPQKIDYSWKQKLSRKVYMSKIMEQIPERWQYGESRDNSREVDSYIKIKEEEDKLLRQQEERALIEQQQIMELLLQQQQTKREQELVKDGLLTDIKQNQQQQM